MKHIHVEMKKSLIGQDHKHRLNALGLGLRRVGQKVMLKDTPAVRGMITKIQHLLNVQVHEDASCDK